MSLCSIFKRASLVTVFWLAFTGVTGAGGCVFQYKYNVSTECSIPKDTYRVKVEAWGAGASGGRGEFPDGVAGGGGGAFCSAEFNVAPNEILTISIPGNGSATSASSANIVGIIAASGAVPTPSPRVASPFPQIGGLGGSTNDCIASNAIRFPGGRGANGAFFVGGGGGGSAFTNRAGERGRNVSEINPDGTGPDLRNFGGGGSGNGGNGGAGDAIFATDGSIPGGGGGGSVGIGNVGLGAAGQVVITFLETPVPSLTHQGLAVLILSIVLVGLRRIFGFK